MSGPLHLVIGRPAYTGGPLHLVLGAEAAPVIAPVTITGTVVLSGPVVSAVVLYDNRNPLRASTSAGTGWAQGQLGANSEPRAVWTDPAPASGEPRATWQQATAASAEPRAAWGTTEARSQEPRAPWQHGTPLAAQAGLVHKDGLKRETQGSAPWQPAQVKTTLADAPHRQGIYTSRDVQIDPPMAKAWAVVALAPWRRGEPADAVLITPWGQAVPVPPGIDLVDPTSPEQPPREISMRLVLACPSYVPGAPPLLVLGRVCTPGALIVIPVRSTYMVQNSVILYRLPAGTEFKAESFTLDIDKDSWTFGWSASLHSSARAHLARSAPDERVEVECVVNGVSYRLAIDSMGRDRWFPESRIAVRGRGRAAELDDVDLPFGSTSPRTAQQLMADVLTVNGVSLGWTLDWQIDDWLVPADTFLYGGSYIGALRYIADAAKAYIQPHPTDKVLRVLPLYRHAPWDWATLLTPDIELPAAVTSVVNIEEVMLPRYNQVFVGGVNKGVFGPVIRGGTVGGQVAPQVLHPLITAAAAHIQCGRGVLSNTGLQEHYSLQTMVLPETGIILPDKALRFVDEDGPHLGVVRKTRVHMDTWPELYQTLGVETHVE